MWKTIANWIISLLSPEKARMRILDVVDGDTVDAENLETQKKVRIRLSGIDAPEMDQDVGPEAKRALESLCEGKMVSAELHGKDIYGRTVADLTTNENLDVEATLANNGLAWVTKTAEENEIKAEANARTKKRGIWKKPAPQTPWDHRIEKNQSGPEIS